MPYLIRAKRGVELIGVVDDNPMRYDWLGSPCLAGLIRANGLLYVAASQCFCCPGVTLSGFVAYSIQSSSTESFGQRRERRPEKRQRGLAHAHLGFEGPALPAP